MKGARIAVLGGGWAGLAAAVQATERGARVTLLDMAPQWGGRARSHPASRLDNGQHILIGAYRECLALMRRVGVDPERALLRLPLQLRRADGLRFELPTGPAPLAFVRGVAGCKAWSWNDRLALLRHGAAWAWQGFKSEPDRPVAQLCARLPAAVRELLVDPLCVAALNTPSPDASAAVFLRVLKDGLFGGPGASDLLLPRVPLAELLPEPAAAWLQRHGARLAAPRRAGALLRVATGWKVDDEAFDAVVLATPAREAARLAAPHVDSWARKAGALAFEPIVTVVLRVADARLPLPMMALSESVTEPAQFVFDHGLLDGSAGRWVFVVSGAAPWVDRGTAAVEQAVRSQAARQLSAWGFDDSKAVVEAITTEHRATFRCTPGLERPPMRLAPRLVAAGDYVEGPYPATLEGAVRSGLAAVDALATEWAGGKRASAMQNTLS
ncbi:MAG: FAD-dependent oxidoreductase [Rubrivivax sp.]|nr:FAD-dependent oxidoreductase [Rubrivivax sp.]